MASTTMHFGPEWMRTKPQPPARAQLSPPSPPPPPSASVPSSVSTYSALVSPAPPPLEEKRDEMHPFRYSREEMLRIYKEGGGKLGLGLEVERWEGVVREVASEPVGLREMGDVETKLFATSINSDLRRRQSTDYPSPLNTSLHSENRPRMSHNSSTNSPLRERFGGYMGKRRDSTDQPPLMIPRKLSQASTHLPLTSPREPSLPSPRTRLGYVPSFDGVFNGGDSWVARRKAAESLAKSSGANASESVEPDPKILDIHEEEDEEEREDEPAGIQSVESVDGGGPSLTAKSEGHPVDQQSVDMPVVTNVPAVNTASPSETLSTVLSAGPPPGLPDLSKVEWSYLDPQGQEQGPFRADLMQKWFDDGYFALDLLMKRVHADKEWTPLGELVARSSREKFFLSPIPPLPSPAPAHIESPLQPYGIPADQNSLGRDGQLACARPFRTPALESYLGNTSTPSDSPSSSFSTGRYGSSDFSGGVGGIAPHPFARADASAGARVPGFAPIRESPPAFTGARKGSSYNEQPTEQLSGHIPSFATVAHQTPNNENFGAAAAYHPKPAPWSTPSNNHMSHGFDGRPESMGMYPSFQTAPSNLGSSTSLSQGLGFGNVRNAQDPSLNAGMIGTTAFAAVDYGGSSDFGAHRAPQLPVRTVSTDQIPGAGSISSYASFGGLAPGQQLTPSTSVQYTPTREQQPMASSNSEFVQHIPHAFSTTSQPPWNIQPEVSIRRPGPFDAPHPTASNTNVQRPLTPTHPSPWGRTSQPSQSSSQPRDPWLAVPLDHADDGWKEMPGPNSLTFSNVGQHNQQHQREQELSMNAAGSHPKTTPLPKPAPVQPPADTASPIGNGDNARPAPAPPRAQRKLGPPPSIATQGTTQATSPPEPSPTVPQPKSAWPKDDDTKKAKASGIALSLREIQEAEAKKVETRKAAEKERERTARNPRLNSGSESHTITTSWGLSSSQAGAARNPTTLRDAHGSSPSPVASATPVWTNPVAAQPTKKTMKEIQEEEERRKKYAVKETAAAAARRAYAETSTRPPPAQPTGGAWVTVGPGSKAATTAPFPARISPTAAVTTSSVSAQVNGVTSPRPTPVSAPKATQPSPPKADDTPVSPSHDFLKWLNDSLKGLNSSVNLEEIVSMLLSFPMDPDSSTIEIISDLIYAHSTVLDGRRFASDFVSRRKADAASRPKGSGSGNSVGKAVSIADVVKAQPKPAQPEWGGFKVVNKRKKGGRS